MTRLANVEKAGYFPLTPAVTGLIAGHISAPYGGRLLDPCAGEGTALVTLAEKLGLEPFGVELHAGRAGTAQQRVARFLESHFPAAERLHLLQEGYLNLVSSRATLCRDDAAGKAGGHPHRQRGGIAAGCRRPGGVCTAGVVRGGPAAGAIWQWGVWATDAGSWGL